LQLNRTHQLNCGGDTVVVDKNIYTIKKNTEAQLGASKKVDQEVNTD
jgi:hypothetical protein